MFDRLVGVGARVENAACATIVAIAAELDAMMAADGSAGAVVSGQLRRRGRLGGRPWAWRRIS